VQGSIPATSAREPAPPNATTPPTRSSIAASPLVSDAWTTPISSSWEDTTAPRSPGGPVPGGARSERAGCRAPSLVGSVTPRCSPASTIPEPARERLRGIYLLFADHGGAIFGDDYFASCDNESRQDAGGSRRGCSYSDAAPVRRGALEPGGLRPPRARSCPAGSLWDRSRREVLPPHHARALRSHLRASRGSQRLFEDTKKAGTEVGELLAILVGQAGEEPEPAVMSHCAYGTAETLERLEDAGYEGVLAKLTPAKGHDGRFGQDDFQVDLEAGTSTCPAASTAQVCFAKDGSGHADFAGQCTTCRLRASCTTSPCGPSVTIQRRRTCSKPTRRPGPIPPDRRPTPAIHRHPAEGGSTVAHFVRRASGGRRACVRGIGP